MDEAFIYVSVISGIFGLIGLQLLTHNWFRKERFKLEAYNVKKQNDLQLKKFARDLGLDVKTSKSPSNPIENIGGMGSLLEMAKGLRPEQLGAIADILSGQTEEETGGGGIPQGIDGLLEFAQQNPELVKGFLDGMKQKVTGENTGNGETGFI